VFLRVLNISLFDTVSKTYVVDGELL